MDPTRNDDNDDKVEQIFNEFKGRRSGIVKALTTDSKEFYKKCDSDKADLCLFGRSDGRWMVNVPTVEIPPDLPDPTCGINRARGGDSHRNEWLSLVSVHSDVWLLAVAFFKATQFALNKAQRGELFSRINALPTVFEALSQDIDNRQQQPEVLYESTAEYEPTAEHEDEPTAEHEDEFTEDGLTPEYEDKHTEAEFTSEYEGMSTVEYEHESTTEYEDMSTVDYEHESTTESEDQSIAESEDMSYETTAASRRGMPQSLGDKVKSLQENDDKEDGVCGACGAHYIPGKVDVLYCTKEGEIFWILCESCERWFHGHCVLVTPKMAKHIKKYKCPWCPTKTTHP